ncbi:carbohydrate kinase family protein [Aestuariispira insulae]|uniref:Pseudouridine kinase n=1 Tax=Aestuariispira insulae TaxID=1461337 RepID=A0A3D9HI12_9PROT|nr:carbohydrate kinase family protein [Aestuariispira insulae]RED49093.1 pseudouridine kinase [Aestuariispira insulae]
MKAANAVLCFGALHFDSIAECIGPYRARASNPVRTHRTPGGVAHNIARNLAQLSLPVGMASLIGDDDGDLLVRTLDSYGIDHQLVHRHHQFTSASYIAVLDETGELAVGLADMAIYDAMDVALVSGMLAQAEHWPGWIIDANLPEEAICYLADHHGDRPLYLAPVSVAKAPRVKPALGRADVMICNKYEIEALSGLGADTALEAARAAASLQQSDRQILVVTLGPDGAVLVTKDEVLHFPAPPTRVVDVNGAGDSFFSGFVAAHRSGGTAVGAVRHGLAKASLTAESHDPVNPAFTLQALEQREQAVPAPITL